ncbi:TfuA-like protein [Shinella sedimenti]|uniref:TfuA-like protein n=1 Tax=Shinella sedimenti TaxID=2919913 RepID=A0ABT0CP60_9HYPH|nr:TfuA-like protein [Shinella sedimenti]MCJ8150385.1 TfuA-like protein [Shinella sedimenti]
MKLLFVGPSLPDAAKLCGDVLAVRPPAVHGDVLVAVRAGATAIGIIDGGFEHVAPVWHKEILYALQGGVAVFGAASMGALRAVECAAFGMVGIGQIYEDYASGRRLDDADVALLHGPAELAYPALSLPLVNVDATLDRMEAERIVETREAARLRDAARRLFYKDRTWPAILKAAQNRTEWTVTTQLLTEWTVNQKRQDALALVQEMTSWSGKKPEKRSDWTFRATSLWRMAANQS